MTSPGTGGDSNSLFGDDPQDDMDTKDPSLLSSQEAGDVSMEDASRQHTSAAQNPLPASGEPNPDGDDTKSDGSFDSLFGGDGDDGTKTPQSAPPSTAPPHKEFNPYASHLTAPPGTQSSNTQFVSPTGAPNSPSTGADGQTDQQQYSGAFSTQLHQQSAQQPIVSYAPQAPVSLPKPPPKPAISVAPPKNAPPLLDKSNYSGYSSDLLMTAFVDGQVVLWDRRVSTLGKGVGRLEMNEKTPPWCLSVRISPSHHSVSNTDHPQGLLVTRWRANLCGTTKWDN